MWKVNEIFSSADGLVQFIELHECCGGPNEYVLQGKYVRSVITGAQYDFPANLPPGTTANAYLLLATPAFAALPGAPTPDYTIDPQFFDLVADEIWYYTYDSVQFQAGELPLDGILSLNADGSTGVNSPTNFDDETGSVVVPIPEFQFMRGDCNDDGLYNIADAIFLLANLFSMGPAPACPDSCDANDDGLVNIADGIYKLGSLFSMGPPPPAPHPGCGVDPTDDMVDCPESSLCP